MGETRAPVHVLEIVGDPAGGVRRHVHSLFAGLDPARFRLSYACDPSAGDEAFGREIETLRPRLAGLLPLSVRKAPHPSDLLNAWRIARYVRANGVQLLHGHGAKAGLYARVAGVLAGVPSVYTPHGGAAHDMFSKPAGAVYRLVERLLAPVTALFLFESRYTAEALAAKLGGMPANSRVNANGIAPVTAEPQAVERARALLQQKDGGAALRIGVIGLLREQKGQQHAIDALALLRQPQNGAVVDAALHLFGGGDRSPFIAQANAAGVGDRVHFHGDVSPVEPWIAACDVILVPSLFESFGYVAVETMMLGRPLVASRTGGLAEVLGDADDGPVARLVPPGDAAAITDALRAVLAEPGDTAARVKRARQRAMTRYSESAMVAGVADAYVQVLGNL